jgi:DNA-binding transcriptional LysR family regulator
MEDCMDQEMKYVYKVYECGSFSKAAAQLYMTQPALSLAVKRAEESIGALIFDRSAKTLTLTEAGEIYIEKYYQIRDLEMELALKLHDLSFLHTGSLTIGGTNYFNSYILPPVISKFRQTYPGIDVTLVEAGSRELLAMLRDHRIDLTFNCGLSRKDPYHLTPCFKDHVLLCVPKSFAVNEKAMACAMTNIDILKRKHLDESFPAVFLKDFKDIPFILLSDGNNLYERAKVMFEQEHITPKVAMRLSQLATAWHLSCEGLGAAFISDHLVTKASDSVYYFRLDSPLAERTFDFVTSENRYISRAMDAFSEVFSSYYLI